MHPVATLQMTTIKTLSSSNCQASALFPSTLVLGLGPSSPVGSTSGNLLGPLFPGSANAPHVGVDVFQSQKTKKLLSLLKSG